MKLFAAILACVAILGVSAASVHACGGMTTIQPPTFVPSPNDPPPSIDPLAQVTFDEVIL